MFPGLQGGPLMHVIAAKAVAFGEALRLSFKTYAKGVVENASTGRDLEEPRRSRHRLGRHRHASDAGRSAAQDPTGKVAETALGRAHITCNKNGIPFDPQKPMITSGVRLGSPAGTTRGFGIAEFRRLAT